MKTGIFYLYVHSEIYRWSGKEMSETEFRNKLFEWRIPKKLLPLIQREMEMNGLIKRNKRNNITLVKPLFNKDDCNHYYRKLQIF